MSQGQANGRDGELRVCIDFGTALSKASGFVFEDGAALKDQVRPLPIGEGAGGENPFLLRSAVFVDEGRIMFGPAALARARERLDGARHPLLSFKSILAAREVEAVLSLKVKPSIDPTGALTHRDVFVLYLAYLDQHIRRAIAQSRLPAALAEAPRRYTNSIWRSGARADRALARLFDESGALADRLHGQLLQKDGASIAQAKDALDRVSQAPATNQLESGVFEAHAAAASYAAFAPLASKFLLVVDMGGGTTDVAGFARSSDGDNQDLDEIEAARQVSSLAGDEIDAALTELIIRKARPRDDGESERAWGLLRLNIGDHKRDLFASGRSSIVFGKKKIVIRREELLNDGLFKEFCAALRKTLAQSLAHVVGKAERQPVTLLLAGGGAHLPFVREIALDLARAVKPTPVTVEQLGEGWSTRLDSDPALARAMPQVAISMGGALVRLTDRAAV